MIYETWKSEETLEKAYQELLGLTHSGFDRTKSASRLVGRLMAKVVNPHPTRYDSKEWIVNNVTDFNIASQLLLNIQEGSIPFRAKDLAAQVAEWEKEWKDRTDSPFEKKAKFLEGDDEAAKAHNRVLAGIRNNKILQDWAGSNSFRISPLGTTPALADLNNITSMSISGLQRFCGARIHLLNHDAIMKQLQLQQTEDGGFIANGLIHPIYSKSGGDILFRALASRWISHQILTRSHTAYLVPKYDSILLLGDLPEDLKEFVSAYTE